MIEIQAPCVTKSRIIESLLLWAGTQHNNDVGSWFEAIKVLFYFHRTCHKYNEAVRQSVCYTSHLSRCSCEGRWGRGGSFWSHPAQQTASLLLHTSCFPPHRPTGADPSWQTLSRGNAGVRPTITSAPLIQLQRSWAACCAALAPGTVKYQINNCN